MSLHCPKCGNGNVERGGVDADNKPLMQCASVRGSPNRGSCGYLGPYDEFAAVTRVIMKQSGEGQLSFDSVSLREEDRLLTADGLLRLDLACPQCFAGQIRRRGPYCRCMGCGFEGGESEFWKRE